MPCDRSLPGAACSRTKVALLAYPWVGLVAERGSAVGRRLSSSVGGVAVCAGRCGVVVSGVRYLTADDRPRYPATNLSNGRRVLAADDWPGYPAANPLLRPTRLGSRRLAGLPRREPSPAADASWQPTTGRATPPRTLSCGRRVLAADDRPRYPAANPLQRPTRLGSRRPTPVPTHEPHLTTEKQRMRPICVRRFRGFGAGRTKVNSRPRESAGCSGCVPSAP